MPLNLNKKTHSVGTISLLQRHLMHENRFLGVGFNARYPLSSLVNYIKVKAGLKTKSSRAWGYPIHITIEPTNCCNLKCPLCLTGIESLGRPKGKMTLGQFEAIIDEIKGYVLRLEIAGCGEPFLNPDLCKMIRYASDAGVWVHLDTNGILINTEQKVCELINSGLGLLNMSIDGASQETYEEYRVGGKLQVVIKNLKLLIEEKVRQDGPYPEIVWQVVVTRNNEHEIEEMQRMADTLGVDRFVTKGVSLAGISLPGSGIVPKTLSDRFVPTNALFHRHKAAKEVVYRNGCSALYKNAFILWNGDVSTCCHDAKGENIMGNIFEAGSFHKVWNAPRYRQLRRQVNADISKADPLCSICPARVCLR